MIKLLAVLIENISFKWVNVLKLFHVICLVRFSVVSDYGKKIKIQAIEIKVIIADT